MAVGHAVHVGGADVKQLVIVHVPVHFFAHGGSQLCQELVARPLAAFQVDYGTVTAHIVQVDERLGLSASGTAADAVPFAFAAGCHKRRLHLTVGGDRVHHVARVLEEIESGCNLFGQNVIACGILARTEQAHGGVRNAASACQFGSRAATAYQVVDILFECLFVHN